MALKPPAIHVFYIAVILFNVASTYFVVRKGVSLMKGPTYSVLKLERMAHSL